jgi:hypothetical protein
LLYVDGNGGGGDGGGAHRWLAVWVVKHFQTALLIPSSVALFIKLLFGFS